VDEIMAARSCVICGASLAGHRSTKTWCCSKECSVAWQNNKRAATKRAHWEAAKQPCPQCGVELPDDRRAGSKYCSFSCKQNAINARWRERSPGYMRQYLYGLTPEHYDEMMTTQGNACAICRSTEWPGKHPGTPHVDHDHTTGEVRGLLCGPCNTGLGQFGDDPARLRAAIEYLGR
jgi:predicted nucleic acid-binding Zn ribbon protein